jgi:hypothetical protein
MCRSEPGDCVSVSFRISLARGEGFGVFGKPCVNNKINLVKLLGAVSVSAAACLFVSAYSRMAHFRFLSDHPGGSFSKVTEFLTEKGWVGYLLPAVALLAGWWALRRASDSAIWIEIVIAGTWLLSLGWFGYCLLMWEVQNCPVFSHMEFHY